MRLFKYLHPDRTDVLRDGTIRFSPPTALNDPFELKPHFSAFMRQEKIPLEIARLMPTVVAEDHAKLAPEIQALIPLDLLQAMMTACIPQLTTLAGTGFEMFLEKIPDLFSQKFAELIGILCLTESPTNLLMWAHYADAHQGFVVEFDPESRFFNQRVGPDDDFRHLRRVVYQDERPSIILTEMEDFSPFLTKGRDWSYETEWRMMMPLAAASRIVGQPPAAVHLFEFPKSMVRSVICGCRMTDSKKAEILDILQRTQEYAHVTSLAAQVDESQYRVNVTEGFRSNRAYQKPA